MTELLKEMLTSSPEQTEELGAELAKTIKSDDDIPSFVALYGDLGVGKTAFVRGLARELCPDALVKSPTYTIVNEYRKNGKELFP